MSICPLCNQLSLEKHNCKQCDSQLIDGGRIMDYFDDYSAYLDIEGMKQIDGIENDISQKQCPHIFYCPSCGIEDLKLIAEGLV